MTCAAPQVDNAIQYGEDADVKVREFGDFEDPET